VGDMPSREVIAASDDSYATLLADLRRIIAEGRGRVAAAVTTEVVATYWQVGERIVRDEQGGQVRAAYGEAALARLGRALSQEAGRAFNERNLQQMRQFYLAYPNPNALRSELPWTAYRTLMRLDPERRAFYEGLAATGRWSSRELERQIGGLLYERAKLSRQPEDLAANLPAPRPAPTPAEEVFRDPYVLDFLELQDTFSERDLEAALVRNIESFLLALGDDFCFKARQRRFPIGNRDYYVDLVFFHRRLRCQVLVDLKLRAFEPADAAQLKLYLNWVREYDMLEYENEPIGLILCSAKDQQVVELLLANPATTIDERIKVAQYLLPDGTDALKDQLARIAAAYERATGEGQAPAQGAGEGDEAADPDARAGL